MTQTLVNRQWLLARRPRVSLEPGDLTWTEAAVTGPEEGEILVKNLCFSCDPTQRSWIAMDTYLPAVPIGDVVRAYGAAQVLESRNPEFKPGDLVQGLFGWQDYATARQDPICPITHLPQGFSIETSLSILGMTGLTAYFGLLEIGRPKPGETVLVSAAAGATGSAVGQIAKNMGCRAIGIAGGPEKCRYLTEELGFDHAIDYKSENVVTRLRQTCPRGIDVYFDNIGGRTLDAALAMLALRGRVIVCGAIATYNDNSRPYGPRNYLRLMLQRGRMEGLVVLDYLNRSQEAIKVLGAWVREGKLKDRFDVMTGLENAPAALERIFKGENRGKQLLKIADPDLS
jgi:NADPH-dependent curcumin reductase CurA